MCCVGTKICGKLQLKRRVDNSMLWNIVKIKPTGKFAHAPTYIPMHNVSYNLCFENLCSFYKLLWTSLHFKNLHTLQGSPQFCCYCFQWSIAMHLEWILAMMTTWLPNSILHMKMTYISKSFNKNFNCSHFNFMHSNSKLQLFDKHLKRLYLL
jgi:hypothetical protein